MNAQTASSPKTASASSRAKFKKHESILRREDAVLLVIDCQKKLVDIMEHRVTLVAEIVRLMEGAKMLGVPIIAAAQYPQGLGPIVEDIAKEIDPAMTAEKMTFSCCGNADFWKLLRKTKRKQVIATGVETHVCVMQTVLDLLANGYQAQIPVLATCSRSDFNRDLAFERMQNAGAILTDTEAVLFELLKEAGTDEFKAVKKLII
ncbi:MAG: isochorismatase family protein [Candidatus Omnitrophota bacterium]